MGSPYNYSINIPQMRDPTASVINSLNAARGIRQTQLEGEKLQLVQQEAERKRQQQQQIQSDLATLSENPDSESIAKMIIKYPDYAENLGKAYEMLAPEEKSSKIDEAAQLYASLNAGRPDIAKEILQEKVEAYRNAGNEQEAKIHERYLQIVDENPNQAKLTAGLMLSAQMGPKEFIKTFKGLGEEERASELQDPKLRESEAKADVARLEADYKEDQIVADLDKQGWDIEKIRNEITDNKENTRIRALESQIKQESNELRKEELEVRLDELREKKAQRQRDKVVGLSQSKTFIDNSLVTIDRVLENPELDNVLGSVEGSVIWPSTLIGTLNPLADGDRRADVLADIETIGGQQFLDNLMAAKEKGATFGSLTEKEGEKLEGYIASLKTRQSESQFKENLRNIQTILRKSKDALHTKYGIPHAVIKPSIPEPTPELVQPGDLPPVAPEGSAAASGFKILGVRGQ